MYSDPMNLADTLSRHLHLQGSAAVDKDVYGIEIELEGRRICTNEFSVRKYWTTAEDGSLRTLEPNSEAIEYKLPVPYDYPSTIKAISSLFDYLNSPGVEVFPSYRTSIHIHLNFGLEEFRTIYNFMTLSFILDELLTSKNGDHRIGNNFTLRARDALGQLVSIISSIQEGQHFYGITTNERYSSINFASLTKFGSIEFRSLECTTDKARLINWIDTLSYMKGKSRDFVNPRQIVQDFHKMGPKVFLFSILGPHAQKYSEEPDYPLMLKRGLRMAEDLAYCSEWKEQIGKYPTHNHTKFVKIKSKFSDNMTSGLSPLLTTIGGLSPGIGANIPNSSFNDDDADYAHDDESFDLLSDEEDSDD
jgi:hypothetical protein